MHRRAATALSALALALSLAACGGEESSPADATGSVEAPGAGGITGDLAEAPDVPAAQGPAPDELVVEDIVVGSGAEAVEGSTVAVKYVGAFYESGEEFDSSWSRGDDETLPVTLGAGQVIPGFEQAITGMQVGGRRMVTIPSELGYGARGQGPIPPDATLVFVLDLVEVSP